MSLLCATIKARSGDDKQIEIYINIVCIMMCLCCIIYHPNALKQEEDRD